MLKATLVTSRQELLQIIQLNTENLKQNFNKEQQQKEGFVTWLYSLDLLEQMHRLAPSVIVKDGNEVAGYALTTLKEASEFHRDLKTMFRNLEKVCYRNKPLTEYHFYCMGQICVARKYRGQGIVQQLYQAHREQYG